MTAALIAVLCCTVALLVTTAYFLLGSVPLLVLRHDTPLDARFVRGFFATYCRAALVAAGATSLACLVAGRTGLAAGAAVLALSTLALRRTVVPRMDRLRPRILEGQPRAIGAFRRLHVAAIVVVLAQLVVIVGSLIASSPPPGR